MARKSKKLGVKTNKTEVFGELVADNKKENEKDNEIVDNSRESTSTDDNQKELIQINETLDNLTIDLLILMEKQMQQKINIEKSMTGGELHLSKSRYILGHKNVSSLQLPIENSTDIDPSITLEEIKDDISMFECPRLKLNTENFTKSNSENLENSKNIIDPTKWFGLLIPRDLRSAQSKFQEAIRWVVDCANNQIKIHQTCVKIKQLKNLKKEMFPKKEE